MHVINRSIFSSIKETNWLISKGICVILFDVFDGSFQRNAKHLLLRKISVPKTCQKSKCLGKKT